MSAAATNASDWPDSITTEVISPYAYLSAQAARLTEVTGGVLTADVTTARHAQTTVHRLTIGAPGIDFRAEVLNAAHDTDFPYPVTVEFRANSSENALKGLPPGVWWVDDRTAGVNTFDELRAVVRAVLRTPGTVSLLQSLLARKSDAVLAQAG